MLHAGGRGLVGFDSVTGTYGVTDSAVSLATAANGLEWLPKNGSFQVKVIDAAGVETTTEVFVRIGVGGVPDTTLDDLVTALNGITNVSASLTADGKLQIDAQNGATIALANDTSEALAALGINTFFQGRDARCAGPTRASIAGAS